MQKQNPVIKNYILSSEPYIIKAESKLANKNSISSKNTVIMIFERDSTLIKYIKFCKTFAKNGVFL